MGELLFETHDNVEHLALIERSMGRFPFGMVTASQFGRSAVEAEEEDEVGGGGGRGGDGDGWVGRRESGGGRSKAVFDRDGWHRIGEILSSSLSMEHVRTRLDVDALVRDWDKSLSSGMGFGSLLRALLVMDPRMWKTAGEALRLPFFD